MAMSLYDTVQCLMSKSECLADYLRGEVFASRAYTSYQTLIRVS